MSDSECECVRKHPGSREVTLCSMQRAGGEGWHGYPAQWDSGGGRGGTLSLQWQCNESMTRVRPEHSIVQYTSVLYSR